MEAERYYDNHYKIAKILSIDHRTVSKWLNIKRYQPRRAKKKVSILDPFKSAIRRSEISLSDQQGRITSYDTKCHIFLSSSTFRFCYK